MLKNVFIAQYLVNDTVIQYMLNTCTTCTYINRFRMLIFNLFSADEKK